MKIDKSTLTFIKIIMINFLFFKKNYFQKIKFI